VPAHSQPLHPSLLPPPALYPACQKPFLCTTNKILHVGVFGNAEPLLCPACPDSFVFATFAMLQVGVFGKVEQFQRELDRIASLLDSDDEEAMGELVHGEQWCHLTLCCNKNSSIIQQSDLSDRQKAIQVDSGAGKLGSWYTIAVMSRHNTKVAFSTSSVTSCRVVSAGQ
jgi:hypothetical protein